VRLRLRLTFIFRYYLESYHRGSRAINPAPQQQQQQQLQSQEQQPEGQSQVDQRRVRNDMLKELLGIDLDAKGTPVQPLFVSEPESPVFCGDIDIDSIHSRLPNWLPDTSAYVGLVSFVQGASVNPPQAFGCSAVIMRVCAGVQAIVCQSESDRIDTKTMTSLVPDCVSAEQLIDYLRSLQIQFYRKDYEAKLSKKKAEEMRIRTEQDIKSLCRPDLTFEEFKNMLLKSVICNHDHPGFVELLDRFSSLGDTTDYHRKLTLLLSGRDMLDSDTRLFANGNRFFKWAQFKKFFGNGPELDSFMAVMEKCIHGYVKLCLTMS
jgi:hypothetical protein